MGADHSGLEVRFSRSNYLRVFNRTLKRIHIPPLVSAVNPWSQWDALPPPPPHHIHLSGLCLSLADWAVEFRILQNDLRANIQ